MWLVVCGVVAAVAAALWWVWWYYPPQGGWTREVAPRVTWDRYSDDYNDAVADLRAKGIANEYGVDLTQEHAFLTAGGFVATSADGAVFFPLWLGTPDDAGGYWYSPNESPAGRDMYGMICQDPAPLADDWWECGLG